ncbi:MAG: hypothetical protein LBN39_00090 [Planctomycetaceae bacterium]|nr:hypothetical protein [Planctomycetaceae bacterium]
MLEPALIPEVPATIDPNLDQRNMRSLTAPVPPSTGAYIPAPLRPLSNVAVERPVEKPPVGQEKPLTPPNEDVPPSSAAETVKVIPVRPVPAAVPESDAFTSGNAVDKMNVRLAKIQLEKKNLPETLKLIDKISTSMFKVVTLVEFAEYVSRDSDYRKEAEQLYALAVKNIENLQDGKPIDVLSAVSVPPAVEQPKVEPIQDLPKPEPPKKEFTVIDEEPVKPAAAPEEKTVVKEEVKTEEPKPEPKPAVKPVLEPLDDAEPTAKQNEKPPVVKLDSGEKAAEETLKEEGKEIKEVKEPTLAAPEPVEVKPEPAKKPSFIVPAPPKVEEPKPAQSKPESAPVKTEEPEKKPASRPLPKKTIKLEEN